MNKLFIAIAILAVLPAATAQDTRSTVQLDAQLLNTDPFPVQSGEKADIRIAIRNTGNTEAEDVTVNLKDRYPFRIAPDRQKEYNIGSITPGEKYYISTEVLVDEEASDGLNDFRVNLQNQDFSRTKDIPIETTSNQVNLNLAKIQSSPSNLKPDTDDAEITLEVANNGEKTAENVVLNIGLPYGFEPLSSVSTRQALGNIAPGEIKPATFRFDINDSAEKGVTSFPGNLSYGLNDSVEEGFKNADFELYLSGAPRYEIVNYESDLRVDSQGKIRITVENTGSVESESTRIRVLDSADLPFSYGSSSAFIGTIQPGQNGTAVFDVTTENGAAVKEYLLDFEVRGVKDTEVFVDDKTLRVNAAASGSSNGPSNALIAGIVALLVVGGAIVFLFRERLGL